MESEVKLALGKNNGFRFYAEATWRTYVNGERGPDLPIRVDITKEIRKLRDK